MKNYKRVFNVLQSELTHISDWIASGLPNIQIGIKLRTKYYRWRLGDATLKYIGYRAAISNSAGIVLGKNFILGDYAELVVADSAPVFIGDDVSIARGSYLRSANHATNDVDQIISSQGHTSKQVIYLGRIYSVVIENDVWIGANVILLTGAHVGTGSVISAGSVVSSEIPPYSIVVGNPGRVVANRKKLAALKLNEGSDNG